MQMDTAIYTYYKRFNVTYNIYNVMSLSLCIGIKEHHHHLSSFAHQLPRHNLLAMKIAANTFSCRLHNNTFNQPSINTAKMHEFSDYYTD